MSEEDNIKTIHEFQKIQDFLTVEGRDILSPDDQLDFNYANLFYLSDQRVIMVSNSGLVAAIFSDKEFFLKCLKKQYFPIPESEASGHPIVDEKEFLKNLNLDITEYIKRLSVFGITEIPSSEMIEENLTMLSNEVNAMGKSKLTYSTEFAIGIYIGEILRIESDYGEWILDIVPELNPYYNIPQLMIEGIYLNIWNGLADQFRCGDKVDFNTYYNELLRRRSMLKK